MIEENIEDNCKLEELTDKAYIIAKGKFKQFFLRIYEKEGIDWEESYDDDVNFIFDSIIAKSGKEIFSASEKLANNILEDSTKK